MRCAVSRFRLLALAVAACVAWAPAGFAQTAREPALTKKDPAEAEFELNSMPAPHGLALPAARPLLHFVRRIETVEWPIRRVS